MSETTNTTTPDTSTDALARARVATEHIPDRELVPIRVDVPGAALAAIGSMPEIEAQRAAIVTWFGAGASALDDLVPAARALLLSHAEHAAVAERDLEPMEKALVETRTRLFTFASVLIERGVGDQKSLSGLEGGQAYKDRAVDVLVLVAWLRRNEEAMIRLTALTRADLAAAEEQALDFGRLVNERDMARAGSSPTAKARARAFTHFVRVHDRVRQMVSFVRWHEGDADRIAPSLYAGKTRRAEAEVLVPAPVSPIPPGMPGASPFITNP